MLAAVEPRQQLCNDRRRLADREITEMPDFVVRSDRLVPVLDNRLVHRPDRSERPPIKPERSAVTKMRVAGEENRHAAPGRGPSLLSHESGLTVNWKPLMLCD